MGQRDSTSLRFVTYFRQRMLQCGCSIGLLLGGAVLGTAAEPRVHLEIAAANAGTLEGPQQWVRTLEGLPLASVRIRAAGRIDQPDIEESGPPNARVLRVTGLLAAGNDLVLPGARIRSGDRAGVERWLRQLTETPPATAEPRGAFGLPEAQLDALLRQLSPAVTSASRDQPLAEFVRSVEKQLPAPLEITPDARRRLQNAANVADELEGLSLGTALAAALRPAGLALSPDATTGRAPIPLHVVVAREDVESWPVGWPSITPPPKLVPKLFDKLQVEIAQTPLDQALAALQARIELPLVIDHAELAQRGQKLGDTKVRFPAKRVSYLRILEQILFQARLRVEVRVDENERPFLWITALRNREKTDAANQ